MHSQQVRPEDARVRDTDFSFTQTKKEIKSIHKHEYPYADPIPDSMKTVRMEDLAAVDISWRMLTMCRPKNRAEEDFFSRLVELGKLRLQTRKQEAKKLEAATSGAPGTQSAALMASMGIIVRKTKKGVTEKCIKTCKECGEELCNGMYCKDFPYESYTRMILDKDDPEDDASGGASSRRQSKAKGGKKGTDRNGPKLKKVKRKRRKKKKKLKKSATKTSSGSDTDSN